MLVIPVPDKEHEKENEFLNPVGVRRGKECLIKQLLLPRHVKTV